MERRARDVALLNVGVAGAGVEVISFVAKVVETDVALHPAERAEGIAFIEAVAPTGFDDTQCHRR